MRSTPVGRPPLHSHDYPFTGQVNTRYGDLDSQDHVNNVAVASFYEEGRAQLLSHLSIEANDSELPKRMVAEVKISYLGQIYYPATLTVAGGILHVGNRSYRIAQALFLHGQCVGHCETVIVHSDGENSIEISPGWREALQRKLIHH